jgi:hypothetical protein
MSFAQTLKIGIAGEHVVAAFLQEQGYYVAPAYEVLGQTHKGPRTFGPDRAYVSPDLWCMMHREGSTYGMYAEVKTKKHFTWRWTEGCFETGIDTYLYNEYLALAHQVKMPVYLLFLHWTNDARPYDVAKWHAPATVDGGLYTVNILAPNKRPRHGKMPRTDKRNRTVDHQMVYWKREDLFQMATIPQLEAYAAKHGLAWPPPESP